MVTIGRDSSLDNLMRAITTDNAHLILLFGWTTDEGCHLLQPRKLI